jgi:hypothetical protein
MSRKSRKEKPVEEAPAPQAPPPEPPPEETPPAPEEAPKAEETPKPEPEPAAVQVESEAPSQPTPAVVPQDDELPPPPSDMVDLTKKYAPLKTRKPGIGAGLKRAGAIFGKDLSIMAKHGLVSSVIVFVALLVIFIVSSYSMLMVVSISMGNGDGEGDGDGGNGPNLSNDGSLVANAGNDISITSGTLVNLDSSMTTHRASIMYVEWRINGNDGQLIDEITLYGSPRSYVFYAIGQYEVSLSVVDAEFNYDEDNFTVTVARNSADNVAPVINSIETYPSGSVMYSPSGTPITLNASSTDDVGVVNYTWMVKDLIDVYLYGSNVTYTFESAGDHQAVLIVRDAAGNYFRQEGPIHIDPNGPSGQWPNAQIGDHPDSVTIGDTIHLGVGSSDGGMDYIWFIKLNDTVTRMQSQDVSFSADGFGMYEILLVVRDNTGNAATDETGILSLASGMDVPSLATWSSTPFGQDIPFNVLTFVYGCALLACVIFIGGLFSKGFVYEIQKGTARTLFFAPISVTNMVFAKLLYPVVIGPIFIFPLMLISTIPLGQDMMDVLMITLVSYALTVLVLISAAYGSCILYMMTKRMSMKPTALARMFMYLSLIATLAIFVGVAFLMEQWTGADMWGGTYQMLGTDLAMFSPFHQGGVLLSNMLLGTVQPLDWVVFVIPAVLIAGGIAASRKLFPDLYARE